MADYCTLYDLKSSLSITDSVDDQRLSAAITAASAWVDQWCGREFVQASGTADRTFAPTGMWEPLIIDDAASIVEVAIDDDLDGTFGDILTSADWQAEPLNKANWPFTRLRPLEDGYWPTYRGRATVKVTATYGWPSTPAAVTQAATLQAARLFKRMDSPMGVIGFGDIGAIRVSRFVDPDVEFLLAPYRRLEAF